MPTCELTLVVDGDETARIIVGRTIVVVDLSTCDKQGKATIIDILPIDVTVIRLMVVSSCVGIIEPVESCIQARLSVVKALTVSDRDRISQKIGAMSCLAVLSVFLFAGKLRIKPPLHELPPIFALDVMYTPFLR